MEPGGGKPTPAGHPHLKPLQLFADGHVHGREGSLLLFQRGLDVLQGTRRSAAAVPGGRAGGRRGPDSVSAARTFDLTPAILTLRPIRHAPRRFGWPLALKRNLEQAAWNGRDVSRCVRTITTRSWARHSRCRSTAPPGQSAFWAAHWAVLQLTVRIVSLCTCRSSFKAQVDRHSMSSTSLLTPCTRAPGRASHPPTPCAALPKARTGPSAGFAWSTRERQRRASVSLLRSFVVRPDAAAHLQRSIEGWLCICGASARRQGQGRSLPAPMLPQPPTPPRRALAVAAAAAAPCCSGTSETCGWTITPAGTRRPRAAQACSPSLCLIPPVTPPWCCPAAAPKVGAGWARACCDEAAGAAAAAGPGWGRDTERALGGACCTQARGTAFRASPLFPPPLHSTPTHPAALCSALASLDRSLRQCGSRLLVRVGRWEEELPALAEQLGSGGVVAEAEVEAGEGGWQQRGLRPRAPVARLLAAAPSVSPPHLGGVVFLAADGCELSPAAGEPLPSLPSCPPASRLAGGHGASGGGTAPPCCVARVARPPAGRRWRRLWRWGVAGCAPLHPL